MGGGSPTRLASNNSGWIVGEKSETARIAPRLLEYVVEQMVWNVYYSATHSQPPDRSSTLTFGAISLCFAAVMFSRITKER
jgi:hypothetical protein